RLLNEGLPASPKPTGLGRGKMLGGLGKTRYRGRPDPFSPGSWARGRFALKFPSWAGYVTTSGATVAQRASEHTKGNTIRLHALGKFRSTRPGGSSLPRV